MLTASLFDNSIANLCWSRLVRGDLTHLELPVSGSDTPDFIASSSLIWHNVARPTPRCRWSRGLPC
jgi:hypothetical protein